MIRLRHNSAINPRQNGLNLDREPMPTITCSGVSALGEYWIEDDGKPSMQPKDNKPPYLVPSMAEIAAVPWNGFKVASTFSGCGGSCLGYRMAGFRVAWASEFIPAAAEVYRANHPETILDTRDIRTVQPAEILEAIGLKDGELDLMDGSPPCASFSTAGKRAEHWGKEKKYSDTVQRTDDLFFEYIRLLDGLKPRVFVAENVSGLVKGVAKGYFLEILARLKACGYRVGVKVLDAQWLGVPQARQRMIFIGVREDLEKEPAFPKPLPYRYSLRDVMPWMVASGGIRGTGFGGSKLRSADAPAPTIMAGDITDRPSPAITVVGRNQFKVQIRGGTGAAFDQKGQAFDPDAPCPTICASHEHPGIASVTHPTEKRKLAIAELKRICAFPDDFVLTGTYAQQWERLGRAVPPVMMSHIARTIHDAIFAKLT